MEEDDWAIVGKKEVSARKRAFPMPKPQALDGDDVSNSVENKVAFQVMLSADYVDIGKVLKLSFLNK